MLRISLDNMAALSCLREASFVLHTLLKRQDRLQESFTQTFLNKSLAFQNTELQGKSTYTRLV